MRTLLVLVVATGPGAALACGGLFCDSAQPVNQAAERILFSHSGGMIDMHVRITYAGPSADFGWILPTPRGVETELSSETLFQALDANFAPIFRLRTNFEGDCPLPGADGGASPGPDPSTAGGEPPPVQVISREEIGPYDRVILDAPDVGALRDWLDANDFAIPDDVDDRLAPYIERDAVFVAIKLLAGSDSGDIVPLHLRFPGDRPAIPILPTAVAAVPDMGVIVHVLGPIRAIPLNYLHVQINEAAIDWIGGGQNYADVVSAAADEAGGHAFATDYAGPLNEGFEMSLLPFNEAALDNIATFETLSEARFLPNSMLGDTDFQRLLAEFVGDDDTLDGAGLAAAVRDQIQPVREHLAQVFEAAPYLTRLYTTLSAEEMDEDPVFSFNPDLDEVPRTRTAVRTVQCTLGGIDVDNAVIRLESGVEIPAGSEPIERQDGRTVRGEATQAAALVEQLTEAGPAVWISEMPPPPPPSVREGGGDAGCGCASTGHSGGVSLMVLLLGLFGSGRRFRR